VLVRRCSFKSATAFGHLILMSSRKPKKFSLGCVSPSCINKPCSNSKWARVYSTGKTLEQVDAELSANTSDERQRPVAQHDGFVWQVTGSIIVKSESPSFQDMCDTHRFVTKKLPANVTASGEPQLVCHSGYQVRTYTVISPSLLAGRPTLAPFCWAYSLL
jgi:hypothetical protein